MNAVGPGIGPVEAGDGTAGLDAPAPAGPAARTARALRARWDAYTDRHPRAGRTAPALVALTACAGLLAAGGHLLAARAPDGGRPAPPPSATILPAPSQLVSLAYREAVDPLTEGTSLAFTVQIGNAAGGRPVTVEGIGQPSPALSVTSHPALPLTLRPGEAYELVLEIKATDCVHVPRNAGLPFLEVTLSNGGAKEDHSYILGDRYARDLSGALSRTCPEVRDAGPSGTS
ncbi:Tat pathway signal sequence domain protein [Streptomyces sp. WAC06614]|uniref:Tat pathway signal sequence domain protein n=1 Tax=Streptomyces sp. WAC06614 TaxID=2487416 RepID=UPI000F7B15F9|nr:Tat pathway signal sequence domain protein [Streptomyces sp. WAC06614]RSS78537.1 Tat pathway signal sequence domain protein [Streptomyces sp. WAC06614]